VRRVVSRRIDHRIQIASILSSTARAKRRLLSSAPTQLGLRSGGGSVCPSSMGFSIDGCSVCVVADQDHVPIITLVNKLDREGRDPFDLLDEIEQSVALDVTPFSWPLVLRARQTATSRCPSPFPSI
jgi:hypothetical protein